MVRSEKKARRLVVDQEIFFWTVGHNHRALGNGRYEDCRELLDIRPSGTSGRLRIVFQEGPGRLVPDGYTPSGTVGTEIGKTLNLHEPGTVRALLTAATARDWRPGSAGIVEVDGWQLFDEVELQRRRPPEPAPHAWSLEEAAEEEAARAATALSPAERHRHLLLAAQANHRCGRTDEARQQCESVLREHSTPEQATEARHLLRMLDAADGPL
ncbi:hypothetical protein [Streptomyces sp. NPDC048172]|uniref:hypothetical protein n=1 Tax=Streptomyces sp. NPDC048172 TaxID=3365505 RepID=UPI003717376A